MTVLAQKPALGVAFAGFQAMVNIIFDKLVKLGVQFGLLFAFGIEGTAVGKLHKSLKGNANSFAAVVAEDAGLMGNTGVNNAVGHHFGFARRLDRMNHGVSGLIAFHRLVAAFIQTGVIIGNMTGRASHAAEVSPFIPALDPHVAALAVGPQVCEDGFFIFKRLFLVKLERQN